MTMTDVTATNPIEMSELTIDELDRAGGGLVPLLAFAAAVPVAWLLYTYFG